MSMFTKVGDWMLGRLLPTAAAAACGVCSCSGSVCGYCTCGNGRWISCTAGCATCRPTQMFC